VLFRSIEIRDFSGAVRSLDELLIDLINSEADAAEIARAFGADHGLKLVSAMQQGESAIRKLVDAMGETSGEAERMASIRMDSFEIGRASSRVLLKMLFVIY